MLIHNAVITGSLTYNGVDISDITGSEASISALNSFSASMLNYTASNNLASASFSTRVVNLESTASVLTTASASFAIVSQSYASASGSLSTRVTNTETTASSLVTASGSFSTRVTNLELTGSSLVAASASFSTRVVSLESTASVLTTASASFAQQSGSNSTRLTNLESTASVLTTASASFAVVSSSYASASGSLSTRVTTIEGSYVTTGSNVFVGNQGITSLSNAISFTSTGSLYTDGGLRITKDMYVSGTAFFNNVTIYGTQSVNYITSSQLNIGTNIITVNTDTPTVRYGGIAVYDSGSTGLTGSLLWDSEQNHWIYTNPSGSTYSGGMMISGPRASARGCEVGTTSCALMMGQGGDHITSSAIFSYGNATCFYGNATITNTGVGCFAGTVCAPLVSTCGGLFTNGSTWTKASAATIGGNVSFDNGGTDTPGVHFYIANNCNYGIDALSTTGLRLVYNLDETGGTVLASFTCGGGSCFASQVCAPSFVGGTISGTTGTFSSNVVATGSLIVAPSSNVELQVQSTGVTIGNLASDTHNVTGSLRITGSGNHWFQSGCVGIGNINPTVRLQVSGTIAVGDDTTGWGRLSHDTTTNTTRLQASKNGTDSVGLSFWTQASGGGFAERMVISGSNVGIGCSAPTYHLEVRCAASTSSCYLAAMFSRSTGANDGVGDIVAFGANGVSSIAGIYRLAGSWGLELQTQNQKTRMRIDNDGVATFCCQVCAPQFIGGTMSGTTIYGSTAICGGTVSGTTGTFSSNVVATGSLIVAPSSNVELQVQSTGVTIGNVSTDLHNVTGSLRVSGSNALFSVGCVGIGTTSPAGTLDVETLIDGTGLIYFSNTIAANNASAVANYYKFKCTAAGNYDGAGLRAFRSANTNDGRLEFYTKENAGSLTERLRIASTGQVCFACTICAPMVLASGCVGINTTAPDSLLHVLNCSNTPYSDANALASGQWFRISNPSTCTGATSGLLFVAQGPSGGNGLATINGVTTSCGSMAITFGTRDASGNVTERMRIASAGCISVGTTCTLGRLTVASEAGTSGITLLNTTAAVLGTETQFITWEGLTNGGGLQGCPLGRIGVVNVNGGTSIGDMVFYTKQFNAGICERLRITSAGSVGIGTTSPDIFGRGDGFDVGISSAGVSSTQNMSLQLNAGATAGRGAQIYMGQGGTRHFTISSNATESTIGTTSNTPLRFVTCDGLERLRITATGIACFACQVCAPSATLTGALRIGTTSGIDGNGESLAICNIYPATGISMVSNCCVNHYVMTMRNCLGLIGSINTFGYDILYTAASATGAFVVQTGGAERMRITSAGNVGINTSPNASSLLHVRMCSNSNGDGIRIQAVCSGAAGSQPGIAFANISDVKRWSISLDNTSDIIQITNVSGLNALEINQSRVACFACQVCMPVLLASGCVGIGTTSPSARFAIAGTSGQLIHHVYDSVTLGANSTWYRVAQFNDNLRTDIELFISTIFGGAYGSTRIRTSSLTRTIQAEWGNVNGGYSIRGVRLASESGVTYLEILSNETSPPVTISSSYIRGTGFTPLAFTSTAGSTSISAFLFSDFGNNNGGTFVGTVEAGSTYNYSIITSNTERLRITNAGTTVIRPNCISLTDVADRTLLLGSRPGNSDIVSLGFDPGGVWKAGFDYKGSDGQLEWWTNNGSWCRRIMYTPTGLACFQNTVCAPQILTPSQPSATVGRCTGWSGICTVLWDAVHNNNGGHYNASTGLFTAPVAGYYLVSVMVMTNNSDATLDIELQVNSATNNALVPYQSCTGASYNQASGMAIVNVSANDTLSFKLNGGSIYGAGNGRHSSAVFRLLG